MSTGTIDLLQVRDEVFLLQFLGFLHQHFAVTEDGIHRRTQLVAHVGEKSTLGLVGRISRFFCGPQRVFRLLLFGDVHLDARKTQRRAVGVPFRDLADAQHRAVAAVFSPQAKFLAEQRRPLPGVFSEAGKCTVDIVRMHNPGPVLDAAGQVRPLITEH